MADAPAAPGRRGTKLFAMAMLTAQMCALIRYTVLARLLGPEQLGLATTLILTAQFFDTVTDSGSDRFLIQNRDGDDPTAQGLVQLVAIGRGVVTAALLVLLAGPIAGFYRAPMLAGGLAALALAPLVAGFLHFDLRRTQRGHDFRIEGVATVAAETISLAVTIAAALIVRDYTTILYGLITRAAVLTLVSHLMAQRPYAVAYCRRFARPLWLFGAPLMLNGLLLFFGAQSDRIIIGRYSGLAELGRYSALLLLVLYPTAMVQRFVGGLFLPRVGVAAPGRAEAADRLGGTALLIAFATVAGFTLVAPFASVILFGPAFGHGLLVVALVGALQTARAFRIWPTTLALGAGRSGVVLLCNVVRLVAIPLALAGALLLHSLEAVVGAFLIGEIAALALGVVLADRAPAARRRDLGRLALFLLTLAGIVVATWGWDTGRSTLSVVALAVLLFAAARMAWREHTLLHEGLAVVRQRLRRTVR